MNSVVIVSGGQQWDSAIHILCIHSPTPSPKHPLPSGLPHNPGQGSLRRAMFHLHVSISDPLITTDLGSQMEHSLG